MTHEETALRKRAIERALRDEGFSRKTSEHAVAMVWKVHILDRLSPEIFMQLARKAAERAQARNKT